MVSSYVACNRGFVAIVQSRLFVAVSRRGDPAKARTTLLCESLLGTIIQIANADSGRFAGARIDDHHVAGVNRHLFTQPTALRVLLAAADVLADQPGTFDDHAVTFAVEDQDLAAMTFVTAGDHQHFVINFQQHDGNTLFQTYSFNTSVRRLRWPG